MLHLLQQIVKFGAKVFGRPGVVIALVVKIVRMVDFGPFYFEVNDSFENIRSCRGELLGSSAPSSPSFLASEMGVSFSAPP
jgi:hypothetical protein